MLRILLSISSILAACTPPPQKVAMPSPDHFLGAAVQGSNKSIPEGNGGVAPGPLADSPAEARGRLILSTAFVRVGPDGHLTVALHDGRVLALRDVVMRPKDYCGVHVAGDPAPARYCGGYAEVAAARPGGAQAASASVEPAPAPPGSEVALRNLAEPKNR